MHLGVVLAPIDSGPTPRSFSLNSGGDDLFDLAPEDAHRANVDIERVGCGRVRCTSELNIFILVLVLRVNLHWRLRFRPREQWIVFWFLYDWCWRGNPQWCRARAGPKGRRQALPSQSELRKVVCKACALSGIPRSSDLESTWLLSAAVYGSPNDGSLVWW